MIWIAVGENVGSGTGMGKYKMSLEYLTRVRNKKILLKPTGIMSEEPERAPTGQSENQRNHKGTNVHYCSKYEVSPHQCYK